MGKNVHIWHPFCRCTVAAYYELDENIVESEQSHKGINRDTQINKKVIESSQYDKKFNNLDENIDVIRKMKEEARRRLNNRNGTVFEDLVFIDAETGKVLRSDNYEVPNTAKPTKRMREMLNKSKPNTIIGIHNHPNSTIPSAEDLIMSYKRGYKYGLIVGHNVIIYKYKANKPIDKGLYNILFDKIQYNGYNKKYTEDLRRMGVTVEVGMITIEKINKKLGFDVLKYQPEEPKVKDTEYDPIREPIFHILTDEKVSFIVDYKLGLAKNKDEF